MKEKLQFLRKRSFIVFMVVVFALALPASGVFAGNVPVMGQTATLGINLDINSATNAMFGSTNTFMGVFSPIYGIGAGAAIAMALLGLISYVIIKAFSRGGK